MKKIGLILILLTCCYSASAQFFKKFDEFWSKRYYRSDYDTCYIGRPEGTKWSIKLLTPVSWCSSNTYGKYEDESFSVKLRSDLSQKISLSGSYYGLSLSAGINPKELFLHDERDYEFMLNSYGKRFGYELELGRLTTFQGIFKVDDIELKVPKEFVTLTTGIFNIYYVFNSKHFSYPAAFTHSFIQKRSAGSVLGGFGISISILSVGDSINSVEIFRVENLSLGLGLGYAYNFVLPRHWMIHVSTLPYITFTGISSFVIDNEEKDTDAKFPEMFVVGRVSVIRSFGRWFTGMMGQLNYSDIKTTYTITHTKRWYLTAFVGVRL